MALLMELGCAPTAAWRDCAQNDSWSSSTIKEEVWPFPGTAFVPGIEQAAQLLSLVAEGIHFVQQERRKGQSRKAECLAARPKGAPEKQVLAWWLCEHTTVRRRRVGERLSMGEESRDTQALRRVRSGTPPEWQRLKEQWERVYAAGGET